MRILPSTSCPGGLAARVAAVALIVVMATLPGAAAPVAGVTSSDTCVVCCEQADAPRHLVPRQLWPTPPPCVNCCNPPPAAGKRQLWPTHPPAPPAPTSEPTPEPTAAPTPAPTPTPVPMAPATPPPAPTPSFPDGQSWKFDYIILALSIVTAVAAIIGIAVIVVLVHISRRSYAQINN